MDPSKCCATYRTHIIYNAYGSINPRKLLCVLDGGNALSIAIRDHLEL